MCFCLYSAKHLKAGAPEEKKMKVIMKELEFEVETLNFKMHCRLPMMVHTINHFIGEEK